MMCVTNVNPKRKTERERERDKERETTTFYAQPINVGAARSSFLLLNMHYKEWSHGVYLAHKRYGPVIKNPCKPFKAEKR